MFPYSANVVEPIMLFDELIRLDQGDSRAYRQVRRRAWAWLMKYPMQNNVWVGYFEDVTPTHGQHEPGDPAGVCALCAVASGEGSWSGASMRES